MTDEITDEMLERAMRAVYDAYPQYRDGARRPASCECYKHFLYVLAALQRSHAVGLTVALDVAAHVRS